MGNNTECHFIDKTVTFDQFVNEPATMIALRIHQVEKGQLEISQTKAFQMDKEWQVKTFQNISWQETI